jgi:PTS system nitrogen regulatory IIA component
MTGGAATTMTDLLAALPPDRIRLDFSASRRAEVLAELARLLGGRDDAVREAIRDDLAAREQISTTAVGGGIAFPHARVSSLSTLRLAFLRTAQPVPFGAVDGQGVDLFLALAGPAEQRREYLSALARVAYQFRSSSVRDALRAAPDAAAAAEVLKGPGRGEAG